MDNEDVDGAESYVPRTAAQTARRSLVLSAVVCRCSLESDAAEPDAKAVHLRVLDWLAALDLWQEAEQSEAAMLCAPLGTLETGVVLRSGWHAEGIAVLAWALNLIGFPKHDEQVDIYAVADAVWFLDRKATEVVAAAKLRSPSELEASRELLYAIHARPRQYARNKVPNDFTVWIEKSWLDSLGLAFADLTAQNDLVIDGNPIDQATQERLQEVLSITLERHRAIIWLFGEQTGYSEITVDT